MTVSPLGVDETTGFMGSAAERFPAPPKRGASPGTQTKQTTLLYFIAGSCFCVLALSSGGHTSRSGQPCPFPHPPPRLWTHP